MPLLRPVFRPNAALTTYCRGPLLRISPFASQQTSNTVRPFSSTPSVFAQGYGNPSGGPVAENPQEQGSSSKAKQNAEHPGPEPPAEGQGSGAGPTKGGSSGKGKSPEDSSAQSGGSRSKDAKETGSSLTGGDIKSGKETSPSKAEDGVGKDHAKPKLLDDMEGEPESRNRAEVEQHNKEFAKGHDRAGKEGGVDG